MNLPSFTAEQSLGHYANMYGGISPNRDATKGSIITPQLSSCEWHLGKAGVFCGLSITSMLTNGEIIATTGLSAECVTSIVEARTACGW